MLSPRTKFLRNTTLAVILAMSAAAINVAQAADYENGLYMRADVGASMFTNKYLRKTAGLFPVVNVAVGYRYDQVRAELCGQYKQKSYRELVATIKVQQISGFLNAYYDIYTPSIFTPYLTAGIGFLHIMAEVTSTPASGQIASQEVAWTAGAGSVVQISDEMNATLGYRYVKSKPIVVAGYKQDISSHEIALGILYNF